MNTIQRSSKFVIIIFVIYLTLAPTELVGDGFLRFLPTLVYILVVIWGLMSLRRHDGSRMGGLLIALCMYIFFCAIIHQSFETNKIIVFIKSSYWCWTYLIAYCIFYNKEISGKTFDKNVTLVTVLFVFTFFINQGTRSIDAIDLLVGDNTLFYSLLMLPWIAAISAIVRRWMLIILISLCAISSLKRSGIIILSCSVILLFYYDYFHSKYLRYKRSILALLVITSVIIIFNLRSDYISTISLRFEMLEDDRGNGREEIYEDVIDRYQKSSMYNQIFGHGYNSVKGNTKYISLSAHNDFLEALYDFGIIGLIFYIFVHLSLIRWTFSLFRARSQLALPVLVSYICFFVMSMVSHLILYPTYFGLLTSFWAFAECKDRQLKLETIKTF